ncbi:DUF4331 family protein [Lacinutrix salivirga]
MKTIKLIMMALVVSAVSFNCSSDDDTPPTPMPTAPDFSGTYAQEDQMGRPAINTVFVDGAAKNTFNVTVPSAQNAAFQADFEAKLLALNPDYTTNALTWDAATFTGALSTDVLTLSLDGPTSFFDPSTTPATVLTGRRLADDVISTELLLIFGGPDGTEKPGLSDDNVDANDKAFSNAFPYLASPW